MKLLKALKANIVQMLVESQSELRPITKIHLKSVEEAVYNFSTCNGTYCLADDVVVHNCDTISMLSVMNAWQPSQETTIVRNDRDIWEDEIEEDESTGWDSYIV